MRKLLCPQCKISSLYIKNDKDERLAVYVTDKGEIISKDPDKSTDSFNTDIVYCFGCSWSGSPKRLVKY